ncbi:MAG TPA: hypothetical protein VE964_07370 [Myxococcales bacterium]|nr:hypothetical protein [Myxococcales bacterium]
MSVAPERELARALERGLRKDFAERGNTAFHLAELLLDAVDEAIPLSHGQGSASGLELLSQRADVYGWDGPPGWDEVLARGIGDCFGIDPLPSPISGLGEPAGREEQREMAAARVRAEAQRLIDLGREAVQMGGSPGASAEELATAPTLPPGAILVALHASLLRLLALSSAGTLLDLPEDLRAGPLPPDGLQAILAEMDARVASGSDFAGAQEEWLARLLRENPAASDPAFRTFFAGVSQSLRLSLSLREWREEARSGQLPSDLESAVGAIGAWQPERWQAMRQGVPAAWIRELCAPEPPGAPLPRLARECELALDAAGRLWTAKNLSLTGFAALATLLFARTCGAVALCEEIGASGPATLPSR